MNAWPIILKSQSVLLYFLVFLWRVMSRGQGRGRFTVGDGERVRFGLWDRETKPCTCTELSSLRYTAFRSNCCQKNLYYSKTIHSNQFFFLLVDNLIKFCYKQRISYQLKNSSLLLTINEYCMFHIEEFFSQQLLLNFISQLSFLHKLS